MAPIAIIGLLILVFGPYWWSRTVLRRYDRSEYFSGTGRELARLLLERCGLNEVDVEESPAGDHYDPADKAVRLARDRCQRRSLTSVVVAAHEVGHAVQDHDHYPPLRARTRLVRTAARIERIGAMLIMAVPVIALITRVPATGMMLLIGGFGTLFVPVLIHLITLPTEFDASFRRALPMLVDGGYIPESQIPAARRILTACALTYVAQALFGLLNVWRWIRLLRR
jgi:Zn-dependent membrane protease YugP